MLKRHLLTLACGAAMLSTPAFSQDFLTPENPDPAAIPAWPVTVPNDQIIVVKLAQPGVRHTCKVKSLTPAALTCSRSFGRDPVVYKPEEVEALINPRDHSHPWLVAGGFLSAGGGLIFAATLVNPIGAVFLGIGAAYVIATAPLAFMMGDEPDTPDHLLYLAPDHKLSVALRK